MISASRGGPIPAVVGPGAARVSAELSRTVSFSDLATREMQLKRDRSEERVSSLYARCGLTYDSSGKGLQRAF